MLRVSIESDRFEHPIVITDGHVEIYQELDYDSYAFVYQLLGVVINFLGFLAKQQSVHKIEDKDEIN